MDEQIKSPIELLAEALAVMTARAVEAERQRDEAQGKYEEWFDNYIRKEEQLKDALRGLDQEIEAHARTKKKLRQYVDKLEGECLHAE